MKKAFLVLTFVAQLATAGWAQTAREEIDSDIHLTAGNKLAYTNPKQKLTPAPRGMKPFYISHYGSHGSQFLNEQSDYDNPYQTLLRENNRGKLTAFGQEILERVTRIRNEATGRTGDLTTIGADQLRDIARRMYERFPEVFQAEATVDSHSTTDIRNVLSMNNALMQLAAMNPKLHIRQDASERDMCDSDMQAQLPADSLMTDSAKRAYEAFRQKHATTSRLMGKLFNDTNYVKRHHYIELLAQALFKLASNVQNTELRSQLTLYDLFTDEELYHRWEVDNAWWYIHFGPSLFNGVEQPYAQRCLLRRIVDEADSCIKQEKPGATLRFGNETVVLSMACLLNLNALGQKIEKLSQLAKRGWCNYRIIPMAANIQLVFYHSDGSSRTKDDVLVKVLLNEDETILPISTPRWPYYRWEEVREFILERIGES